RTTVAVSYVAPVPEISEGGSRKKTAVTDDSPRDGLDPRLGEPFRPGFQIRDREHGVASADDDKVALESLRFVRRTHSETRLESEIGTEDFQRRRCRQGL